MTRTTWQDGFYVDYDRLVTGELWKVRENGASSGVGVLATYSYDDLRRRTGADLVSGIAMFIPGGQPFGVSVRGLSLGFQAVEAGANIYVGARTGNWTGIQSQGAAFVAGGLLGAGAGRWLRATGIPGRMSPLVRSRRINAVSVAYGNALGGAASAAYCGTQ